MRPQPEHNVCARYCKIWSSTKGVACIMALCGSTRPADLTNVAEESPGHSWTLSSFSKSSKSLSDLACNIVNLLYLVISFKLPTCSVEDHGQFTKRDGSVSFRLPTKVTCKITDGVPVTCCISPPAWPKKNEPDLDSTPTKETSSLQL